MIAPEVRRFPITLRELEVVETSDLSSRMRRITLGGPQLGAFEAGGRWFPEFQSLGPCDHIKIFFQDPETEVLSLPRQGDGRLHWPHEPPVISREYTPRSFDSESGRLNLDFVLHDHGVAGMWAAQAQVGQRIHIGGPRASRLLPQAAHYLLMGDETALPAIANWLEMLPATVSVTAHILIASESAKLVLRHSEMARVYWHICEPGEPQGLARCLKNTQIVSETYVWAGGECLAITALRTRLNELGVDIEHTNLGNYWTKGARAKA